MPERVVRLGVSLEPELLGALDRWVRHRNSPSRSDAIRFLIRKELSEATLHDPEADAVGTVMVLYRHTSPNVLRRLTSAQHRWGDHIQSSTHFHLQGDACLEVMVLKGKRKEVEAAAEDLRGVKGIVEGDFLVGTPQAAGGASGHHHPHAHWSTARTGRRPRG
jgi:CopG family nickel-responsive transcriptional regulator